MILNKASFERGFAHATVYKSEVSLTREKRWSLSHIPITHTHHTCPPHIYPPHMPTIHIPITSFLFIYISAQLIDLATCGGGRDKNHLVFGKFL